MALVRPRLTDHFGIAASQEAIDFAIPFLDEDIPLCVDPFLLWKSPSQQDNALHLSVVNSFNHLGTLVLGGEQDRARDLLIRASECEAVGLGFSTTRVGKRLGASMADNVLILFTQIPQLRETGFLHVEEIQLLVEGISRDRISDLFCSFAKSFLIDYTIAQSQLVGIPLSDVEIEDVYDARSNTFRSERVTLPVTPENGAPILLVPKRWLRRLPWIGYDDYVKEFYPKQFDDDESAITERAAVLTYNRDNYGVVQRYVAEKERTRESCTNDPLFDPIPVLSAKRRWSATQKLPTGKTDGADRAYEDQLCTLMASLLYPALDFAAEQSRTDSGTQIRDLLFYNSRAIDFLEDIYRDFGSKQLVFELKNVNAIERQHISQLNRYLADHLGRFGVFITRNDLSKQMFRHTVDLWSGQRKCIIALTDADVQMMVDVFESKQRDPIEVLKKKYIEFVRACPS